jgi:hypothetical protein
MGQVFMRLFKEKVPGTDRTYVEVMGEVNQRVVGEMKAVMTTEQQEKYDAWAPDPTDIEIPDGPIIKHVVQYIKAKGDEERQGR